MYGVKLKYVMYKVMLQEDPVWCDINTETNIQYCVGYLNVTNVWCGIQDLVWSFCLNYQQLLFK